ncbi:hypothetical protein PH586_15775 [Pseudomonas sp. SA3-5]|uniref:Anti-sigma factor n=1 Tax=Pseudomonas aestuarii TaxID=3018340 RepID=A0ABT4XI02_9PSED|nr:hypothetical protein [Pseudomonas aestuarii]MDA7087850.1 hypothetical protein [Pseudomonas aestuarii]
MNRDQYDPQDVAQERALLEHFRAQSQAEPSAELDAQILAAARAAQPAVRPGWSQRLHSWLFGHAGRQRWSLAVAGLASVGIGVSLTWRTLAPAPEYFIAPMPRAVMAPAAPMADTAAPHALLREQAAPGYAEPRQKAEKQQSMSVLMGGAVRQAPVEVEALADAPVPSAELSATLGSIPPANIAVTQDAENMLMQLLELRRAGKTEEARALQQRLHLDYPQMEIEAQLERIGGRR